MGKKKQHERLIDEDSFDVSAREQRLLDDALHEGSIKKGDFLVSQDEEVSFSESRSTDVSQLTQQDTRREKIRVLFITSDVSIFDDDSHTQNQYTQYAQLFDEMHVVVLTLKEHKQEKVVQLGSNIWIYPTHSKNRLYALYDAYQVAKTHMVFAAGFRADIIFCASPFEEGLVGYVLAKMHDRALQVEVQYDFFDTHFLDMDEANKWRVWIARFILPKVDCMFVTSARLRKKLLRIYKSRENHIVMLPPYRDLTLWRDSTPTFDLKVRYPQFQFIILTVIEQRDHHVLETVIDSCALALRRYKTIGLVVVGSSRTQSNVTKRLDAQGITGRVVFEALGSDMVSYMKTADVLLNVGGQEEDDVTLTCAAAAGLPVITVSGEMADALFEDDVSGYVCSKDDVECLSSRISDFLNNNQLRTTFAINARDRVFTVIDQDKEAHLKSFAGILKGCIVMHENKNKKTQ